MPYDSWFFRKTAFLMTFVVLGYCTLLLLLVTTMQRNSGLIWLIAFVIAIGGPLLIALRIKGARTEGKEEIHKWAVGSLLKSHYVHWFYLSLLLQLVLTYLLTIAFTVDRNISLSTVVWYALMLIPLSLLSGLLMDLYVKRKALSRGLELRDRKNGR